MHLITITRPSSGRWQTGVWLTEFSAQDNLVLDQLPMFISKSGDFVCLHPSCAGQNLAQAMIEWSPDPWWLHTPPTP